MEQIIFHVDVNSAFLSWEAVYRMKELGEERDLRLIPSAIGGDAKTHHGIILAKSVPAKKYHIQTAETIVEARRKCPDLVLVQPHHDVYKRYSKAFMDILCEYSPIVEQYSIDEAYLDMTGTRLLFGEPIEAAKKIKDRIYEELGFTVNIGISNNKLLAKMASDFEKPNKVHTLFPEEVPDKMWKLPVEDLFFCGKQTAQKLHLLEINTIGDLARADMNSLKLQFKSHGETLWKFANGIDVSIVEHLSTEAKGYSNSVTMPYEVRDRETAQMVLMKLCESVGERLRRDMKRAGVVAVTVKDTNLHSRSHQMTLQIPTNITNELLENAMLLFDELWDGISAIRLLGVATSKVVDEGDGRQMDLFTMENYEKLEKLDAAIDDIRGRYGKSAIMRATYVEKKEE